MSRRRCPTFRMRSHRLGITAGKAACKCLQWGKSGEEPPIFARTRSFVPSGERWGNYAKLGFCWREVQEVAKHVQVEVRGKDVEICPISLLA